MRQEYLAWKYLLSELNDFSCKIEFLQINIRKNLMRSKNFNIAEYVCKLSGLLEQHSKNLTRIEENNCDYSSQSGNAGEFTVPSTGIDEFFMKKKQKLISVDH